MKLKTKFVLFIAALHLVCVVQGYLIFGEHKILFIVSELLVLVSVVISFGLYRQMIMPLAYLKKGINAIKDRDFNVKFRLTGKGEMDELIDVYNRMMDELRKERTRQEEQHFFLEKLIQTSPTGIIVLDYDHQVKQVNPRAAEILGDRPGIFLEQISQLREGEPKTIRVDGLRTYKIQKSHFIDRGFARVFLMIEEVTAVIFEAEKNVYSKVIRMMAHEVNNTIGPVNSIMNLALKTKELWGGDDQNLLKNALQVAVERNQNLNFFMRNFADLVKLSPSKRYKVDAVSLIYSVARFMQIRAEETGIDFKFELPAAPFYIQADLQQMEQAIINIVKNAIEAIEKNGTITFSILVLEKKILISDTGAGISDAQNEQLFSPFFSTKKDGQGIGLTLVREILLNHGFEFFLKTVKQGQTDFVILVK